MMKRRKRKEQEEKEKEEGVDEDLKEGEKKGVEEARERERVCCERKSRVESSCNLAAKVPM